MNSAMKFGYFLCGIGVGVSIASILYERELTRATGEIEEYIPKNDDISDKVDKGDKPKPYSNLVSYLGYTDEDEADRRAEFEKFRSDDNQKTRYSSIYKVVDKKSEQNDISRMNEKHEDVKDLPYGNPDDDEPYEEDIVAVDNELVRERVENNFEIYLDENPQDFVSLIFYEGDSTLTDDREHIVPAAEEVVGAVALSRLIEGGPGAEDGVIFVRNLKTMINYEIVLDAGSYSETVLGILNSRRVKGAGGDVSNR